MQRGYFTTKKLIMFILVCIQFANMAFAFALSPSLNTIQILDFSILLMLVVLYVDPEYQRRTVVPMVAAIYIVNLIYPYLVNPTLILSFTSIFVVLLAVGTFFFGKNVFNNTFNNSMNNWIITFGAGSFIGLQLYFNVPYLLIGYINPLNYILLILNILGAMVVPVSMIIYTWLKRFRIE